MFLHVHCLNHAVNGRRQRVHVKLVLRAVNPHLGARCADFRAVHLCRRRIHAQSRRPFTDVLYFLRVDVQLCLRQVFHCLGLLF